MNEPKPNPTIRFGGREIPTHSAWSKLEIATQALEVLSRYNRELTPLATDLTRKTEAEVRKRLGEIEILLPKAPKRSDDLVDKARALLLLHAPEDVVEMLEQQHHIECDLDGLIHLAGAEAYLQALTNEAEDCRRNAISYEQIAQLWNDAKRPAPGKPFWDRISVERLLNPTR